MIICNDRAISGAPHGVTRRAPSKKGGPGPITGPNKGVGYSTWTRGIGNEVVRDDHLASPLAPVAAKELSQGVDQTAKGVDLSRIGIPVSKVTDESDL